MSQTLCIALILHGFSDIKTIKLIKLDNYYCNLIPIISLFQIGNLGYLFGIHPIIRTTFLFGLKLQTIPPTHQSYRIIKTTFILKFNFNYGPCLTQKLLLKLFIEEMYRIFISVNVRFFYFTSEHRQFIFTTCRNIIFLRTQ